MKRTAEFWRTRRGFLATTVQLSAAALVPEILLSPNAKAQNALDSQRVDAADVDGAIWAGNAAYQTNRSGKYGDVILGEYIARAFENNPNLKASDVQTTVDSMKQFYSALDLNPPPYVASKTPFDAMSSMLTAMGAVIPGTSVVATLGKEALSWTEKGLNAYLGSPSSLTPEESFDKRAYAEQYQGETWSHVYEVAQQNPEMAKVIDKTFGQQFGVNISDSASAVLEKNPDYADHETIKAIAESMSDGGNLYVQLSDLTQLSSAQHDAVMTILSDNTASIATLNAAQTDMIAYIRQRDADQAATAAATQAAEQRRAVESLTLNGARSGVFLLSTFAGLLGNSAAGKAIDVVGNAAINIADAVSQYEKVISAGLGSFAETLGGIVMTGNIVGAVMSLTSLFGGGADQAIFEELQKISKQIEELGKQMNARFDRVDTALNAIYNQLADNFSAIEQNLRAIDQRLRDVQGDIQVIQRDVQQIQERLVSIQDDLATLSNHLSSVERDLAAIVRDGFAGDLKLAIFDTITYGSRHTADAPMSWDTFNRYALLFVAYATVRSSDPVSIGPQQTGLDQLVGVDGEGRFISNLNFLLTYARQEFNNHDVAQQPVADPIVWLTASSAYVQLIADWPDHAKKLHPAVDLASLSRTGGALRRGLPAADAAFLKRVAQKYRDALKGYLQIVDSEYARYRTDMLAGIDPWAGIGQNSTYAVHGALNWDWGGS